MATCLERMIEERGARERVAKGEPVKQEQHFAAADQPRDELGQFAEKAKGRAGKMLKEKPDAGQSFAPGTFGTGESGKVFVSALFKKMQEAGELPGGLDLPTFKRWLQDARNAGHVALSRADLVEAMDPDMVRESEGWAIPPPPGHKHGGLGEFHFVRP